MGFVHNFLKLILCIAILCNTTVNVISCNIYIYIYILDEYCLYKLVTLFQGLILFPMQSYYILTVHYYTMEKQKREGNV